MGSTLGTRLKIAQTSLRGTSQDKRANRILHGDKLQAQRKLCLPQCAGSAKRAGAVQVLRRLVQAGLFCTPGTFCEVKGRQGKPLSGGKKAQESREIQADAKLANRQPWPELPTGLSAL